MNRTALSLAVASLALSNLVLACGGDSSSIETAGAVEQGLDARRQTFPSVAMSALHRSIGKEVPRRWNTGALTDGEVPSDVRRAFVKAGVQALES
jgi:hypothetical protein